MPLFGSKKHNVTEAQSGTQGTGIGGGGQNLNTTQQPGVQQPGVGHHGHQHGHHQQTEGVTGTGILGQGQGRHSQQAQAQPGYNTQQQQPGYNQQQQQQQQYPGGNEGYGAGTGAGAGPGYGAGAGGGAQGGYPGASSGIPPAGNVTSGHVGGGSGGGLTGKIERTVGSLIGSESLKAKGLQKEQEANAIKMQGSELAEAERLEREARMRRERAVGHGAHPDNLQPSTGHNPQVGQAGGLSGGHPSNRLLFAKYTRLGQVWRTHRRPQSKRIKDSEFKSASSFSTTTIFAKNALLDGHAPYTSAPHCCGETGSQDRHMTWQAGLSLPVSPLKTMGLQDKGPF
ncbi:hypothetical protein Hypma_002305 [Hypsizygus marmoreus]|uniref:Uncharacterized protein n=1 Tax=Hypsizygus marmoreus TaxID=39966 RepID=A0A369K503_HYPMA|nr:hypothetical protein Hypma_002305 [Hypsizygus marmoreus]